LPIDWLPPAGRLLFFYDVLDQPWGYDPTHAAGWAVRYVPAGDGTATTVQPLGIEPLARQAIRFVRVDTFPSETRPGMDALQLTDAEWDAVFDRDDAQYQGEPEHRVGGFPSVIQNDDMELESQLASSGIDCGDAKAYRHPRIAEMQAQARDWRLLLQFDTDDDLDVMWGDAGRLYFWVRERDARAGRFDQAWVILQCT
ncbi:MAG TPA: YwqG family protein, partial [Nevskiaceae bacterium]|nr:YwqG family protein [Nevskiaceae bacterium]